MHKVIAVDVSQALSSASLSRAELSSCCRVLRWGTWSPRHATFALVLHQRPSHEFGRLLGGSGEEVGCGKQTTSRRYACGQHGSWWTLNLASEDSCLGLSSVVYMSRRLIPCEPCCFCQKLTIGSFSHVSGALWASSIAGSILYNFRKPGEKMSVKLIHARYACVQELCIDFSNPASASHASVAAFYCIACSLHAQALTLSALIAAAGVEYWEHSSGEKAKRVAEQHLWGTCRAVNEDLPLLEVADSTYGQSHKGVKSVIVYKCTGCYSILVNAIWMTCSSLCWCQADSIHASKLTSCDINQVVNRCTVQYLNKNDPDSVDDAAMRITHCLYSDWLKKESEE